MAVQDQEQNVDAAMGLDRERVYLIDALVFIFRAYHALPSSMTGPDGQQYNAVHGFISFLAKVLKEQRPQRIAVAFDASLTTCFRNRIDPEYKANRPPADPEFKAQIQICRDACEAAGLLTVASEEYEADDYIATLAALAQRHEVPVTIVSRDKDLLQLLHVGDVLWDGGKQIRGVAAVDQQFGVRPDQMPDFQGMVGDSVDNIPGVPGIGPKAAAAVLAASDTLDAALENPAQIAALPFRGAKRVATLLQDHQDAARRSRQLATLVRDVEIPDAWSRLTPESPPQGAAGLVKAGLTERLATRLYGALEHTG